MFFIASKALWFLAAPSALLILGALIGAAFSSRRRGQLLAFVCLALLLVIGAAPVGALNDDLRAACLSALEISPQACLAFAAKHTWEASARAFIDNIANVRAAGPVSDVEPFAAEQPRFVG